MPTPQEMLTKIHETGIFGENWNHFPTKMARLERIRLYREQLRQINRQLKESEGIVKSFFDGRNQAQAVAEQLNLIPYSLIRDLLENVNIALKKVELDETTIFPQYGEVIYGDLEEGYWAIGDKLTAQKWLIKHRANKLKSDLALSQNELQRNQKIAKSRTELYFVIGFVVMGFILAIFGFQQTDLRETSSISLLVITGLMIISSLSTFVYWLNKRKIAKGRIIFLENQIAIQKNELNKLKKEFQNIA